VNTTLKSNNALMEEISLLRQRIHELEKSERELKNQNKALERH